MKKLIFAFLIVFAVNFAAKAQFQFASISDNGEKIKTIPRYAWTLPFNYPFHIGDGGFVVVPGVWIVNNGVIYRGGIDDQDKFKSRVIGSGFSLSLGMIKDDKPGFLVHYRLDNNWHTKQKYFPNGVRADKEVFRHRDNRDHIDQYTKINHSIGASFYINQSFGFYFNYYLKPFFNTNYEIEVDGIGKVRPFENLSSTRFDIGFAFSLDTEK